MKKFWIFTVTCLSLCLHVYSAEKNSTIPVLDMNMFYTPATRSVFVEKLSEAFHEVGFVAITNTGVQQHIVDNAYSAIQAFFALDLEQKAKYINPANNGQRGYILTEKAKGMEKFDHKEFYHVGRILTAEQQNRLQYFTNIWPREVNFQARVYPLFEELEKYLFPLESAIAEALDIPEMDLHQMTREGDCLLRMIHYPKMPNYQDQDILWAGEHTDIDLLTILPIATTEGLEAQDKEGNWIRVKVPEDALIINVGDMLESISNGYFRSAKHRVRAVDPNTERFSMVLFIHPKSEDRVDPLPQCIERTGGVRKYAHATRWELLMERLADLRLASPEMLKELSDSGLMERLIEVNRASVDAMQNLKDHGLASPEVLQELDRLTKEDSWCCFP